MGKKRSHTPSGVPRSIFAKNAYKEHTTGVPRSIFCKNAYKGQEEIVGFGLIIIIVAVVLLVFLSISLRNTDRETVESFEIESFIQAFLQHTSDCRRADNLDFLSVQRLIFSCNSGDNCLDGKDTCGVLNETLKDILDESWKVGEDRPIKGRKLEILSNGENLLFIEEGNMTSNSKGAVQEFFRSGSEISINFVVYY